MRIFDPLPEESPERLNDSYIMELLEEGELNEIPPFNPPVIEEICLEPVGNRPMPPIGRKRPNCLMVPDLAEPRPVQPRNIFMDIIATQLRAVDHLANSLTQDLDDETRELFFRQYRQVAVQILRPKRLRHD